MNNNIKHKEGTKCPSCNSTDISRGGILILRKGHIKTFLGCSKYPECKYISPLKHTLPGLCKSRVSYQSHSHSRPSYKMVGKRGRVIARSKPNRG